MGTYSSTRKLIFPFVGAFFRFSRGKGAVVLFLLVLRGLTQGVSILMLIPMLQFAGVAGKGGGSGDVPSFIARALQVPGYELGLVSVLIIYVALVSLYELFDYCHAVLDSSIQQRFVVFLRNRLHAAIARANWLFISRKRSSDLIHVLTVDTQRIGSGTHYFLVMLSSAAVICVHIALAFVLSPAMAITVVGCALGLSLILRPLNRKALGLGLTVQKSSRRMLATVTEHLGGMKVAKSFGSEARYIERFRSFSGKSARETVRFGRLQARATLLNNVGAAVCIAVLFYAAVAIFQVPLIRLFLLIFLFARILPRITALHQNYQQVLNMLPSFTALAEMQEYCEGAAEPPEVADPRKMEPDQGIFCHNVSFRYGPSGDAYALRNIDLLIPARKMTAIIGPSGAGKTTLADILLGLLTPTSGTVCVDDLQLDAAHLYNWRHSVGYVPQEPFLFHDTIRANLLFACPDASEEDILQALETAAAAGFVNALPQGLDTIAGDRGVRLSGGERQRIAMARALIRKPDVLFLDEATSSLDKENETRIREAMERLRGGRTIMVIAHRLSTVQQADMIIVLDKGLVVEQGSWAELSAQKDSRLSAMIRADGIR